MSKMTDMKTPRNRLEFERNFNLLKEQGYQGKMHFMQGTSHVMDSLNKVKILPNGRIDLLTINEGARLQANMMNNFANMIDISSTEEETE